MGAICAAANPEGPSDVSLLLGVEAMGPQHPVGSIPWAIRVSSADWTDALSLMGSYPSAGTARLAGW